MRTVKINKYQEALNHIIRCDREDNGVSNLSDVYRNDISDLQELIDKYVKNCYTDVIDALAKDSLSLIDDSIRFGATDLGDLFPSVCTKSFIDENKNEHIMTMEIRVK